MEVPNFIQNMDWHELKLQKRSLLEVITNNEELSITESDALNGILHVIDALQDYAVDETGVSSDEVFDVAPI